MQVIRRVLTLVVVLFVFACGGGGGNSNSSSSSTSTSSSSTSTSSGSPGTLNLLPPQDSTGNPTDLIASAIFSEAMLGTSIDASSFTLSSNAGVRNSTVNYDGASNTATLTPDSPLGTLQTYTATLNSSITNLNGIPISPISWSFTTRDGNWGLSTPISSSTTQAQNVQAGMDKDGNVIAVWMQWVNADPVIWANRYVHGIGWGAAEIIQTDTSVEGRYPHIAVQANGNAIVVWEQFGTQQEIWSSRYIVGTGWSTTERIDTGNQPSTGSTVVIDDNGNAIAAWAQNDGTRYNMWANRYMSGSGWGVPELIESNDTGTVSSSHLQLSAVMDASGNAMVVWNQQNASLISDLWSNRYVPGTGWGTPELIDNENLGSTTYPDLAVDGSGNVLAVWAQNDGGRINVWANRYVPNTGWGSAEKIESDLSSMGTYYRPKITMNANGNAIAVWSDRLTATSFSIVLNSYSVSVGWGTATTISPNTTFQYYPAPAIDNNGNAFVIWERDVTSSPSRVLARRYINGSGWGPIEDIKTDGTVGANASEILIHPDGSAVALWTANNSNIYQNRFE